ncbi:MAG: glycosyltransferase [Anaerolineaceae bacterium]|nr:glycosyltransferase [Anaerolineaceae bacterium]
MAEQPLHKDDPSYFLYQQARIRHWDRVAADTDSWGGWGGYYRRRLQQIYRFLIPPGLRILDIGCGSGDLLASLQPAQAVGIDVSNGMVELARRRHPHLRFIPMDAHDLKLEGEFDAILLADSINDFWDVQRVFEKLAGVCHPGTRLVLNYYSRLWELPLRVARNLNVAIHTLYHNWLTGQDTSNQLYLAGFEVIRKWEEIILPFDVPLLAPFFNRFLVRLGWFQHLGMTSFTLARPQPRSQKNRRAPRVSVVVPARNEAGNIEAIFERVPEMGSGTELILVEGHSTDNTYAAIEAALRAYPKRNARLIRQPGRGKGDAVRAGFAEASGEILMILDADLTAPPEDLPRFYEALVSGRGEFINGVRLVYPMEKEAMRFFNVLGNKFFSLVFSWLLGQPVKDTLCGTKVMWKKDYQALAANRSYFGDFDPFGDFDLLFGASKLNLKIVDLPVRYRERTYGDTNIQRWKHGLLLLRMVVFAASRLKFV